MSQKSNESNHEQGKSGGFIKNMPGPPSLQKISSLTVTIHLWTREIEKDFGRIRCKRHRAQVYRTLEKEVLLNLNALFLPIPSKVKVIQFIRPIGLQLFDTYRKFNMIPMNYEDKIFVIFLDYFKNKNPLCWTVDGVIDKVNTFHKVINNGYKKEDIFLLFRLACELCLEEQIQSLWSIIPQGKKTILGKSCFSKRYESHLFLFWIFVLTKRTNTFRRSIKYCDGEIYDSSKSINKNMMWLSIKLGNPVAFKYFWNKLTDQEKEHKPLENFRRLYSAHPKCERFFFHYQSYSGFTDIYNILLLQLDLSKQIKVMKNNSLYMIQSFFHYHPLHEHFLPMMTVFMDLFPSSLIIVIMISIAGLVEVEQVSEMKHHLLGLMKYICRNASRKSKVYFYRFLEDYATRSFHLNKVSYIVYNENYKVYDESLLDEDGNRCYQGDAIFDYNRKDHHYEAEKFKYYLDDSCNNDMDDSSDDDMEDSSDDDMDDSDDDLDDFDLGNTWCNVSDYEKVFSLENEAIYIFVKYEPVFEKNHLAFVMTQRILYSDKNDFRFGHVDSFLFTIQLTDCEIMVLKERIWEQRERLCHNSMFSEKNRNVDNLFRWCSSKYIS